MRDGWPLRAAGSRCFPPRRPPCSPPLPRLGQDRIGNLVLVGAGQREAGRGGGGGAGCFGSSTESRPSRSQVFSGYSPLLRRSKAAVSTTRHSRELVGKCGRGLRKKPLIAAGVEGHHFHHFFSFFSLPPSLSTGETFFLSRKQLTICPGHVEDLGLNKARPYGRLQYVHHLHPYVSSEILCKKSNLISSNVKTEHNILK